MVMVVVEDVCLKYHGHMYYLLAVYFILPELFVVVDYCCHGDGSGGVHLYTKYITTRTNNIDSLPKALCCCHGNMETWLIYIYRLVTSSMY